ncbi:MAG: DUF1599 domain-containing protein [Bacteroidales bacterium]|nr:DUF1599 domain-containing protein [Bacteroidales bacterium]
MTAKTNEQFQRAISVCRDIYVKKMSDYGTSWRIMRPSSVTDQIMIKAKRIRQIEMSGQSRINEGIRSEFIGIVNYAAMALIQLDLGPADQPHMDTDEAARLYDEKIAAARALMGDKNTDYNEAWRDMRVSSFTDIILMKINRTKEIENNAGHTIISEGVDANYMDMINYALFALIQIDEKASE